jgi:serine/threonine-protein kinase
MQQQGMTAGAIIKESYQLARKLGEGGMGEVWEAFNPRLPKVKYAIKFLFGHSTTSEQFERFQREAKILTALDHENITRIHDLDFSYHPPFIVLEYLDGEPLSNRLERAREHGQMGLPLPEVINILGQVGAALKTTHARGVIHRDLKPENIYLCHQPNSSTPLVKVLDFGVSKMSGEEQITQHQQGFLGTPQYMSPEQALGYENLDHRAD